MQPGYVGVEPVGQQLVRLVQDQRRDGAARKGARRQQGAHAAGGADSNVARPARGGWWGCNVDKFADAGDEGLSRRLA